MSNSKMSNEAQERPKVFLMYITEKSLAEGFHNLVGYSCDIFAKFVSAVNIGRPRCEKRKQNDF